MHPVAFFATLISVYSCPLPLTRREWLRLSAGAGTLLSLGLWPGRLRGADAPATDNFTFIAVNDLHALEPACRPWFDETVRQMKTSAPNAAFCLLGGDFVRRRHTRAIDPDQGIFRRPWHLMSRRGRKSRLTVHRRIVLRTSGFFRDKSTTRSTVTGGKSSGSIPAKAKNLRRPESRPQLYAGSTSTCPKLDPARPTILFTHFPLGAGVFARPLNADDLLQRFHGVNLQAVFCGHYHGFTERPFRR